MSEQNRGDLVDSEREDTAVWQAERIRARAKGGTPAHSHTDISRPAN